MAALLKTKLAEAAALPHIWWGVSVENRQHGLPRIEHLRGAPAGLRFMSVEPLLEDLGPLDLTGIGWVILGGESGAGARPMERAWVESIKQQCQRGEVPFFFKQWGRRPQETGGPRARRGKPTTASRRTVSAATRAAARLQLIDQLGERYTRT